MNPYDNDNFNDLLEHLNQFNINPLSGKASSLISTIIPHKRLANLKKCFYDRTNTRYRSGLALKFTQEYNIDNLNFYLYCKSIFDGVFIDGYPEFEKFDEKTQSVSIINRIDKSGDKSLLKFLEKIGETVADKHIILIRDNDEIHEWIKHTIKQIINHPNALTEDYITKTHSELSFLNISAGTYRTLFYELTTEVYSHLDDQSKKQFKVRFKKFNTL